MEFGVEHYCIEWKLKFNDKKIIRCLYWVRMVKA